MPRPLPLGVVTNVMGVAYDPVIKGVVWIEGGSNGSVATAQLNGSKHRVLTTYHNIFPLSLAYDSNGGHVFWTNTSGTQIELVAYNGGQGVMLNQHSTPVPPSVRLPIAMDTNSRYVAAAVSCPIIRSLIGHCTMETQSVEPSINYMLILVLSVLYRVLVQPLCYWQ